MSKLEFEIKLEQLNDPELAKELKTLFIHNPEEANLKFRIAMAHKIMSENKSLFERLSKL